MGGPASPRVWSSAPAFGTELEIRPAARSFGRCRASAASDAHHRPDPRCHTAKRFLGSLWSGAPSRRDASWAMQHLLAAERELWSMMSDSDQRHAIRVARQVAATLGSRATRPVLAAALLHDVGKTASGLGTFGRTAATLAGLLDRRRAQGWGVSTGVRRRIALYIDHPDLGADQLAQAGSDALTVAWAREHHRPEHAWSVPAEIGRALRAADQA